jgi:AcrR family transcriptional regulator
MYRVGMPRLWDDTIAGHRSEVRDAVLDATAALVAEQGLLAVTMSQIATRAGIGRATLYKYFPDVSAILSAWHQRQVEAHLGELAGVAGDQAPPGERLRAVLTTYAHLAGRSRRHHDQDIVAALHQDEHVLAARQRLSGMVTDLLAEAAAAGTVRRDVPVEELAEYCLAALAAAGQLDSEAAFDRLLRVVLGSLSPSPEAAQPQAVGDHEHRAERHRGAGDEGVEQAERGQR